jgi:non-specific serine/threonine protein kinase
MTLASANAPIIASLCQHLDGLPLAIELAAARVRLLSPRAMLTRLTDGAASTSLDLLAAGALDMPPRHQTLRAAIGWSHELLNADHQALFRRLAVFLGGCTLEMADAVCGNGPTEAAGAPGRHILDSLGVLVENHLLRRETTADGEPRFRMLTTIREYAAERLQASGEAESVRHRHALAMMQLAQQAERELGGPRETELLDVLEREYDNLRAALGYLTRSDAVDAGLRASRALWRFWSIRGQLSDGRAWLAALLERDRAIGAPPSAARSLALSAAGWMALEQDDIQGATALCQEGLEIARACGDNALVAEHLSQLGHAARQQGNYSAAHAHYEESLALRQASNDRLGVAWSLRNLAHVARLRGEYERACALYEESLTASGPTAPRSEVAGTLGYLGNALLRRGDLDEAHRRFAESLTICRDIGHRRRLAYALEGLAGVAAGRGLWERSLRLAGAATALRELIGAPLWPAGLAALEYRVGPARQQLGPARAAECWSAGRALPLDAVVAEALAETQAERASVTPAPSTSLHPTTSQPTSAPAPPEAPAPHPLTHREVDVARLIARGHTNRQIAEALVISEGTAAVHVKHILNKLGLESRTQVAAWAFRSGLVTDAG